MDYLKKVLGIQTKYKESRFEGLPNFIYHIYHLHMADNPSFLSHQKKRQIRFPLSKKRVLPLSCGFTLVRDHLSPKRKFYQRKDPVYRRK